MSKKKYSVLLLILSVFVAIGFSFSLLFGVQGAYANTDDFSIVFDEYDGDDLTVSQFERVSLPTATFFERNVNVGKAEVYVYDSQENLVAPYRKGNYLFTATGEYQVVYRPIGYADKGIDGGANNLTLNLTVTAGEQGNELIFPVDSNLASGLLCDYNEEFYLADAFNDYGNAKIYLSQYPEISREQVEGENYALKLVKGSKIANAGLYFGANITSDIDEFSYVSVKLKTDADEVYLAGLSDTKFYKMKDLKKITLGDFSYGESDYQTVYVKATDLGLTGNGNEGLQIVFDGAQGSFVEIDEIGFIANRQDYKFITSLTEQPIVIGNSYKIDMTAYLNGIKIENPVLDYSIPDEYSSIVTVTDNAGSFFFNAVSSGNVALRVKYYQEDGINLITEQDISIKVLDAIEAANLLTDTLGTNELVNWSNSNYKWLIQKSSLIGYQDEFDSQSVVNAGYNARYYNGSYGAASIAFPGQKSYTDGYVTLTCIFDGNNAGRTVKLYKYGETNPENAVATFDVSVGNKWVVWSVPVSELVDENGVLKGIQLVHSANWINLGKINYVPEADYVPNYVLNDNVSTLAIYENGKSSEVVSSLERDGFKLDNADYYIEVTSSDTDVVFVEGMTLTPYDAGTSIITVSYYTDSQKTTLVAKKETLVTVDTIENILTATLADHELVKWDNVLYQELVTDSTIANKSMANENTEYPSFVNVNTPHGGYFFDYVPASGAHGSGRNILFPVQRVYENGYVKVKLTSQSGAFASYSAINVYKYGETLANNYLLRATGNDALNGLQSIELYVPVSMLTNSEDILQGIQITAEGLGWLRIENIEYVAENAHTPTYGVMENIDSLTFALGGSSQTVSVSLKYDGMTAGLSFDYTAELSSSNQTVATVSGLSITPVYSGSSDITLTIKDGSGATIATATKSITIASYAEMMGDTLGENELVNWKSSLQQELVTDTTISEYAGKLTNKQYHGDPYYCYQFKSIDAVDSSTDAYVGLNIEFAVKNSYTKGYVEFKITSQRGSKTAYIYKFGETNAENIVQSCFMASGNVEYTFKVPVTDLLNDQDKLDGIQIVINLADGNGYLYSFNYVEEDDEPIETGDGILTFENGETGILNYLQYSGNNVPATISSSVVSAYTDGSGYDGFFDGNVLRITTQNSSSWDGLAMNYYLSLGKVETGKTYYYNFSVRVIESYSNIASKQDTPAVEVPHQFAIANNNQDATISSLLAFVTYEGAPNCIYYDTEKDTAFYNFVGTYTATESTAVYFKMSLGTYKDTTVNIELDNMYLVLADEMTSLVSTGGYGTSYYVPTTDTAILPDGSTSGWKVIIPDYDNASMRMTYRVYGDFKQGSTYKVTYKMKFYTNDGFIHHVYDVSLGTNILGIQEIRSKALQTTLTGQVDAVNRSLDANAEYLDVTLWLRTSGDFGNGWQNDGVNNGISIFTVDIQIEEVVA